MVKEHTPRLDSQKVVAGMQTQSPQPPSSPCGWHPPFSRTMGSVTLHVASHKQLGWGELPSDKAKAG